MCWLCEKSGGMAYLDGCTNYDNHRGGQYKGNNVGRNQGFWTRDYEINEGGFIGLFKAIFAGLYVRLLIMFHGGEE